MPQDYYDILGVDKRASSDEMKKAYRKLAMKFHPDRNKDPEAENKLKEINQAYDVLKDEQKRAAYDRFGHAAFEGGMGGGARGGGGGPGDFGGGFGGAFSDIFEDMFGDLMGGQARGGARRSGNGPLRGSDLQYTYEINLEEAFKGKEATITIPTHEVCDSCNGSGAEKGTGAETCPTCKGTGRIRLQQGFFTIERTCATCQGQGTIVRNPCKKCGGKGRVRKEKTLKVRIPAGVDTGRRIRLGGEGEAGLRGGPNGDLYVLLSVRAHKFFRREGSNLHCKVPIPMTTAALGAEIEVPTIDEARAKVKIPAGTQTGQQLRLRGKGMSSLNTDNRGDMFIEVMVETPVSLSRKQQDILKQLDATIKKSNGKNSPASSGFFSKMKELWDDLTD